MPYVVAEDENRVIVDVTRRWRACTVVSEKNLRYAVAMREVLHRPRAIFNCKRALV